MEKSFAVNLCSYVGLHRAFAVFLWSHSVGVHNYGVTTPIDYYC